jgi:hypothetical protein
MPTTTTTSTPIGTEVNWDYIVKKIQEEKYILLLGPELSVSSTEHSFQEALHKHLVARNIGGRFYAQEEFYSFKDEGEKLYTYFEIQNFFNSLQPLPLYEQLAKIPFHCIISLSPDLFLKRVFEQKGLPFYFDYYDKTKNPRPIAERPNGLKPLLYNLLGSVEDEESMIFTHTDLFDYLIAVFGSYKLPDTLRMLLKENKNFIFLGFEFEKWYMKLLLRLLDMQDNKLIDAFVRKGGFEDTVLDFYSEQFSVKFVQKDVREFVEQLYGRCETAGILRKESASLSGGALGNELRNLVAQNHVEGAFKLLRGYVDVLGGSDKDDVTLLQSSFNQLMNDIRLGLKTEAEVMVPLNRIKQALLELISRIFK